MKVMQKLRRGMPGGGSSLLYILLRDSVLFPFLCVSSFARLEFERLNCKHSAMLVATLCLSMQVYLPVGAAFILPFQPIDHSLHCSRRPHLTQYLEMSSYFRHAF